MVLINKLLTHLNSLNGISTVLYESPSSANLRIDRKPSPYAILYLLTEVDIDADMQRFVDGCNVEIFFCEPVSLDAKGDEFQQVVDRMLVCVKDFLAAIKNDNDIVISNNEVKAKTAVGKFDKHCAGVSIELTLKDRKPQCFGSAPIGGTLTITENGEYNVSAYSKVIVTI